MTEIRETKYLSNENPCRFIIVHININSVIHKKYYAL